MYSLLWLPQALRDAGLTVIEQPGWQTRGHGDVGPIQFVLCHHTASPPGSNAPDIGSVTLGRPDLPGPNANLLLARDGTYYMIAAGKAWHAGKGLFKNITDGNGHSIGIEAENNGINEPWPENQMVAYAKGCAAILKHIKANEQCALGHKEWALPKGRKIDPNFDMIAFRKRVASYLQ